MSGRIILVEGNIASGKSTLCQYIFEFGEAVVVVLHEPFDPEQLAEYYSDPFANAEKFQLYMLTERKNIYQRAMALRDSGHIVLIDRSIFSDVVYAKQNLLQKSMTQEAFENYLKTNTKFLNELDKPDLIIYLSVEPEVCYYRINTLRQLKVEATITLEYLEGLHRIYEEIVSEWMRDEDLRVVVKNWSLFGDCKHIGELIGELIGG